MSRFGQCIRVALIISTGLSSALSVGCGAGGSKDQDLDRRFKELISSDGEKVDVVVADINYFPVDLLDWAKERRLSGGDAIFARVGTMDKCYILGPKAAIKARVGSRFHGVVSADLVRKWPPEVFTAFPTCLSVEGEVIFSPIKIRVLGS